MYKAETEVVQSYDEQPNPPTEAAAVEAATLSTTTNPNFDPQHSTHEIWRGDDSNRCLSDDLDAMDESIANLESGKAPTNHEHSGYSETGHTHTQENVSGLIVALAAKAAAEHNHELSAVTGILAALAAKADLVDGKIPASQLPASMDEVIDGTFVNTTTFNDEDGVAVTPSAGKVYQDTTTNHSYRWSGSAFVRMDEGVALGETASTAHRGDHGKAAYDHSVDSTVHVTAAQKTSWDGKAAGDHTHATEYIAKALQFLNDSGGVEYSYGQGSGKNLLTETAAAPQGVHTAYAIAGTAGNPNTVESWRYIYHKTSPTFGWLLGFGNLGSVYANYLDTGTWMGWVAINEANPAPLWTGAATCHGTQTITPTKTLSQCKNGWVLVWSDYDTSGLTAVNAEACITVIPKRGFAGGKWTGQSFLAVVAAAVTESADAVTIKRLQVYDAYLTGHAYNTVSPRNDVVLRAVYEF